MCRTFAACSMNNKRFHSKEAFLSPQLFVHLAENLSLKSFEHLWLYIFRLYQVFLRNCIPLSIPKNEEYPHLKKNNCWETMLLSRRRYNFHLIYIMHWFHTYGYSQYTKAPISIGNLAVQFPLCLEFSCRYNKIDK